MYLFLFISIFILFFILNNFCEDKRKAKIIYILFFTIVLSLGCALKNLYVGADTERYYHNFKECDEESYTHLWNNFIKSYNGGVSEDTYENRDLGYPILVKIFTGIFGLNFELFMFFVGLGITLVIGRLIYLGVKNFSGYILAYGFYIILFYHYLPNSAIRQTIALTLYLYAIILWVHKYKRIVPILLILLASTIHQSVLIGFIPLCINLIKNKKLFPIFTIGGFLMMLLGGIGTMKYLSEMTDVDTYNLYLESTFYKETGGKPIGYIIQICFFYAMGVCFKFLSANKDRLSEFSYTSFSLGVILSPLILIDPSLIRADAYLVILGIIFIPNIINAVYDHNIKQLVFIILLLLTFGRTIVSKPSEYKFNWEKMKPIEMTDD